jgi:hypothetical protein
LEPPLIKTEITSYYARGTLEKQGFFFSSDASGQNLPEKPRHVSHFSLTLIIPFAEDKV